MRRLVVRVAVVVALALPMQHARAQAFCSDGSTLEAGAALLVLEPLLPDVVGEPTECEHPNDNGDLLQATTGGLAFWQIGDQTAHFTNGSEQWSYADGELTYGLNPPPPVASAPPPEPPPAPVVIPPVAGPELLPWTDATSDPSKQFLYWAKRRCTYAAEAFERGSPNADLVVTFDPNVDAPLGRPGQVKLRLQWQNASGTRAVAGAVVSTTVGANTVRWASYADRIVQDLVLPVRPAGDRLQETLRGDNIVPIRTSAGDYVVSDTTTVTRYFVRAPSAVDASGRSGTVTLSWTPPNATIALDPSFAAAAAYPVTVSTTVEFAGMVCV